ncbi:hypothetical protein ILP92_06820 [Maribius pontilimi]|uniref:Lipoprotein n=1 Tax=Palleronia pontilimi TaxID=1964209 RepID=A0A934MGJ5_9RHOB|nr:hypothetical protein [Palleronia pontilimi]MBJ3762454.1 hypothetical protein [Palleronia pontilimi]
MLRSLALLLALSACAAAPGPDRPSGGSAAPRAVTLYRDTVVVQMSDGSLCTGVRAARAGPWETTLNGCPHTWPVAVKRPTTLPRLPLAPTEGDPWVRLSPPGNAPLGFGPRVGS